MKLMGTLGFRKKKVPGSVSLEVWLYLDGKREVDWVTPGNPLPLLCLIEGRENHAEESHHFRLASRPLGCLTLFCFETMSRCVARS